MTGTLRASTARFLRECRCMTVSSRGVTTTRRRLPVGAELLSADAVHFRVWAPTRSHVEVTLEDVRGQVVRTATLDREDRGYFSGIVEGSGEGTLYRYSLDKGERFPDPASRFQPQGPHGPSCVVDPGNFQWTHHEWRGP